MLSNGKETFTKENLDTYLKELAKEFRKRNGKTIPAEIILVGGAAILVNYGFRDMTTDIDVIIHASSVMKDAINFVGDKYRLPVGWLNADFVKTESFTPKLYEKSIYYKTFSNILTVRVVAAEYLIAMKLRAGRKYKNDLSDIIGILAEHEKMGNPITLQEVESAVQYLYNGWEEISEDAKIFIQNVFAKGDFKKIYDEVRKEEQESKKILIEFQENYTDVLVKADVNDILKHLKEI